MAGFFKNIFKKVQGSGIIATAASFIPGVGPIISNGIRLANKVLASGGAAEATKVFEPTVPVIAPASSGAVGAFGLADLGGMSEQKRAMILKVQSEFPTLTGAEVLKKVEELLEKVNKGVGVSVGPDKNMLFLVGGAVLVLAIVFGVRR